MPASNTQSPTPSLRTQLVAMGCATVLHWGVRPTINAPTILFAREASVNQFAGITPIATPQIAIFATKGDAFLSHQGSVLATLTAKIFDAISVLVCATQPAKTTDNAK